ncbi:hypothetical protein ONS96_006728 [Cadophora gregata f. sp. sojae]|nr:hypothetical protein ONS96_006728 [Cadophora gregata f. sp. sojae]
MRLLCHCISCKKVSGSLFQSNSFCNTSQFTISPLTAPNSVKTYIDKSPQSKRTVHRSFCSECGSRLWNTMPDDFPDKIAIMAGVLDLSDEEWKAWAPEKEFFCKRRGDWMGGAGAPAEGRSLEM